MVELVFLWVGWGRKEEEGMRKRQKRISLFLDGFDFYIDFGILIIRDLWRMFR